MPENELNLIIDADTGDLYKDTSCRVKTSLGKLGPWRTGWTYNINMLLVAKDPSGVPYSVDIAGDTTIKLGRTSPSLGVGVVSFSHGAETVNIDADELNAARLEAELNGLTSIRAAGKVDVSGAVGNYLVVFRELGDVDPIIVTPDTVPTASGTADIVQGGTGSVREKVSIRIVEDYAVAGGVPTLRPAPSANVTVQQDGASLRHIEIIEIDEFPSGGSFTYSHTTTAGEPVSVDSTSAEFEALLTGKTVAKIGRFRWRITWDTVGTQATGVTDSTGIEYFQALTCTFEMTTGQLYAALGGGNRKMILEVGDDGGEIYFSGVVPVGQSLGELTSVPDSIYDTDGNVITDTDGNPI